MAEVDARAARGAPAAPITSIAFGKLIGLTAEHRPVAASGGLIDAFAEVFASMSRRSDAIDSTSGHRFGVDQGSRELFTESQATSQDDVDSNSHQSRDSTQDRPQLNRAHHQKEADEVEASSLAGAGSSAAAQLEQAIGAVRDRGEAQPGAQGQLAETISANSADDARGGKTFGGSQSHQQERSARQLAAADGSAASLAGSEFSKSTDMVEDASGDPSALQMGSRIAKKLATRRGDMKAVADVGSALAKTSNQVPRGALQPAANTTAIAAEAAMLASQGMTSSETSPKSITTPSTTATINQLQALAPLPPGAESIVAARTTAKSWNQSVDFSQPPSPDLARIGAGTGTNRSTGSTSDVVARIKLIQRVSKAFQQLGPEGGSVRIRLAPAELGSVRVEMQVHDRQVRARVVAETEAASNALREHLPDLRARLESYGMQVERLEVETETSDSGFETRQQTDSQWQSQQQQRRSGNSFAATTSRSHRVEPDVAGTMLNPTSAVLGAAHRGVDVRL